MDNYQCLASLALFRQLYDNKQHVYSVLAEFLRYLIIVENTNPFNLSEISSRLNNSFAFKIPDAVVKTALKSLKREGFLEQKEGQYYVIGQFNRNSIEAIESKLEGIKKRHSHIVDALLNYIEDKSNKEINEEEKKDIIESFCSYILDDSSLKIYSDYISAFILDKKNELDFASKLNVVKEGVVLYSGLKYSIDPNKVGSWDTNLVIFLSTEVLFYFAGYNGKLYKTLFEDFFNLIKEINNADSGKKSKSKIELKYFRESKNEIDSFFSKAEQIVDQQLTLDPSKTAMCEIVKGCKARSDVFTQKSLFFKDLENNGIVCDDFKSYYSEEQKAFNLVDENFVKSLRTGVTPSGYEPQDCLDALKLLSYINVLRKGISNNGFENVGYIFLTSKNICHSLAWHKKIKSDKDIPLATSLDFLTDKFWYKLNKGFGGKSFPATFNIITKAQLVLSSYINNSITKRYDDLRGRYNTKQLSKEQAIACLVDLRKHVVRPEELEEHEDFDDVLKFIKDGDIENSMREREILKQKSEEVEKENERLKQILNQKDQEQKQTHEKLRFYEEDQIRKEQKKERLRRCKVAIFRAFLYLLIFLVIGFAWYNNWLAGLLAFLGLGGLFFLKNKLKRIENWLMKLFKIAPANSNNI